MTLDNNKTQGGLVQNEATHIIYIEREIDRYILSGLNFMCPWSCIIQCYGHVMGGYINSPIREVMEVEITGKRKKGRPTKSWEEGVKEDLEQCRLRKRTRTIERNGESKLE